MTSTDYLARLTPAAMPLFGTVHKSFVGTALGVRVDGGDPGPASTIADAQRLTPSYTRAVRHR